MKTGETAIPHLGVADDPKGLRLNPSGRRKPFGLSQTLGGEE